MRTLTIELTGLVNELIFNVLKKNESYNYMYFK